MAGAQISEYACSICIGSYQGAFCPPGKKGPALILMSSLPSPKLLFLFVSFYGLPTQPIPVQGSLVVLGASWWGPCQSTVCAGTWLCIPTLPYAFGLLCRRLMGTLLGPILFSRYGLYSSPFDPVLFDLEMSGSSCKSGSGSSVAIQSDEIDFSDVLSGSCWSGGGRNATVCCYWQDL